MTNLPPIVSPAEWQAARDQLLIKEKAATRELDALAAERRRLPMVAFDKEYVFDGADGKASLVDLFAGRRQLIIYHFMWHGDGTFCSGCSSFTDNIGNLEHLYARDTSYALVYRGPLAEIEQLRNRLGWTLPIYSSHGGDFDADCGLDGGFGMSVFLRDAGEQADRVYRTYFTTGRGVDRLRVDFNLLDLTPYGRQESWEDSPSGWPQTPPYQWWRHHDEYPNAAR